MIKKYKCSKCGKSPYMFTELWKDSIIEYDVNNDGYIDQEGWLSPPDRPYCVYAECRCGHSWRLRGVLQITDVRGYQNE